MIDVVIGGYYNHYKNKPYKVLDVARHSEDLSDYVVYQALYKNDTAQIWIRPYKMFVEQVNGKPRFELCVPPFEKFHAHIYFDENSQKKAEVFHKKFQQNEVSPLRFELRGPHPHWMFTLNFTAENFMDMVEFMQKNRDGLSILIHPLSGNELLDHTEYAMFLGERRTLHLAVFSS